MRLMMSGVQTVCAAAAGARPLRGTQTSRRGLLQPAGRVGAARRRQRHRGDAAPQARTSGNRAISRSRQLAANNRCVAMARIHRPACQDLLNAEVQSARSPAFVAESASLATEVDKEVTSVQVREGRHIW